MTHDQRHIKETREMFQKAGMIFTDGGHELQVQRKHYSLRLTESYTCGLEVEMKAMQRIKFSTHQLLERDLTILDNLCEVHHLLASLQPRWCTTQTMLLFGKKPGDPLLLFHCGNHSDKPIGVYDRPASVSSVHKCQPVYEFPASATPKEIADYLRNKHAAVQPAVSWEDFVDQWNLQHSARLGYQLSCGPSYIYSMAGVRFLHDGKHLFMEVFRPINWLNFPKVQTLLESILQTAKMAGLNLEFHDDNQGAEIVEG